MNTEIKATHYQRDCIVGYYWAGENQNGKFELRCSVVPWLEPYAPELEGIEKDSVLDIAALADWHKKTTIEAFNARKRLG